MMTKQRLCATVLVLLAWVSCPVYGLVDGYRYDFESTQQAKRFEQLLSTLRCPVCQNQNLSDSNSEVAIDLRDKVFELMQAGKSDDDITHFLVARYGAFVRYQPAFNAQTWLLWLGPVCLLGLGLWMWWRMGTAVGAAHDESSNGQSNKPSSEPSNER